MDAELIVYLREQRIGVLVQNQGRLAFNYDRAWLLAPDRHPLSLSLPLRETPFDDAATRTWFGNLLPEGDDYSNQKKLNTTSSTV